MCQTYLPLILIAWLQHDCERYRSPFLSVFFFLFSFFLLLLLFFPVLIVLAAVIVVVAGGGGVVVVVTETVDFHANCLDLENLKQR